MPDRDERVTTADIAGVDEPQADDRTDDTEMEGDGVQASASSQAVDGGEAPLFSAEESQKFSSEWSAVQASFVDQPREAVEHADQLVADLMQRLAGQFAETRSQLEQQWDGQEDVSTEDLRVAMTRYRSFFERLLAA